MSVLGLLKAVLRVLQVLFTIPRAYGEVSESCSDHTRARRAREGCPVQTPAAPALPAGKAEAPELRTRLQDKHRSDRAMEAALRVTGVRMWPVLEDEESRAFVGRVAVSLACGLRLDALTLRCYADRSAELDYPTWLDRQVRWHAYVVPLRLETRQLIERQVLELLDLVPREEAVG